MKEEIENKYVKRTQKDYFYAFKLEVVREVETGVLSQKGAQLKYGIQGHATILTWLRKYGNFDWEHKNPISMPKTTEQRLMELEQKVRLLEKQKKQLEYQNDQTRRLSYLI